MDPERVEPLPPRRRRRSRRRARRRAWYAAGAIVLLVLAGGVARMTRQPALPRGSVGRIGPGVQPRAVGDRSGLLGEGAFPLNPPTYPYSVVTGGVHSIGQLRAAIAADRVVAGHYADFDISAARVVALPASLRQYVSYRVGDSIYWTKQPLTIPRGELVVTDGQHIARTQCANRLSPVPQAPVRDTDPPIETPDPVTVTEVTWPAGLFVGSRAFLSAAPPDIIATLSPAVPVVPIGLAPSEVTAPEGTDPGPAPVPEPATMLMMGTGLAGLLAARVRARRRGGSTPARTDPDRAPDSGVDRVARSGHRSA